jgi:endonuclease III
VAESAKAKKARAARILARLAKAYPGAGIELRFGNALELLTATILSAQCTDERVNAVTQSLFTRYKRAEDLARAHLPTLEREIHSTGFYKAKARSLVGMGRALCERHAGEVPRTLDELTALPGVGRKTANVVLGNAFGIPALAVDTHVTRVRRIPRRSTTTCAPLSRGRSGPRQPTCSSSTAGAPAAPASPTALAAPFASYAPGPARRGQSVVDSAILFL